MRNRISVRLFMFLLFGAMLARFSVGAQSTLNITPVYQQTPVWCWAAVGEMVFRHYGVANINPYGNFQCGIIALLHPRCNQDCRNCVVPAGSLTTMNNMLTGYPRFAAQVTGNSTLIDTSVSRTNLPLSTIETEINSGRPIVAGISPSGYQDSGISQHVALIVGYTGNAIIVNDPFPFRAAFSGNPYVAAGGVEVQNGRYRIAYDAFVSRLRWRESITTRRMGNDDGGTTSRRPPRPTQPQYGRSCQTAFFTCGPFLNQPAMPVGSACWCGTPQGPVTGRVVQP